MSAYRAVGWNRQKKRYDLILVTGIALYLCVFIGLGVALFPTATAETLLLRGAGTAAFFLLHVILSIGPLCRLNPRFLPLLYNRRHMGVTMFLLGLFHAIFSLIQYHALGEMNPVKHLFVGNPNYGSLHAFPFETLGAAALLILFLMAATSHDFWLANLSAPVWKKLHMMVYVAYGLLVMHVTLGVLQTERHPALAALVGVGLAWVIGLHLLAGFRERRLDAPRDGDAKDGWIDICAVDDIPNGRAHILCAAGERIAIFHYDGNVAAVSNACQHQNGPLGEGRVINGCIVCPWHGFEYKPETGASPPPFHEKICTFRTRVQDGRVYVDPTPRKPGAHTAPSQAKQ